MPLNLILFIVMVCLIIVYFFVSRKNHSINKKKIKLNNIKVKLNKINNRLISNSFFRKTTLLLLICSGTYAFIILWGEVFGQIQPRSTAFGLNSRYVILPFDIAWYCMQSGDLYIEKNNVANLVLKDSTMKGFLLGLLSFEIITIIFLLYRDKIQRIENKRNLLIAIFLAFLTFVLCSILTNFSKEPFIDIIPAVISFLVYKYIRSKR